ncbi:MAG: LPS export ABC transporter periplasmic protein LptC [Candidatus Zixiibacteriota bacterium]
MTRRGDNGILCLTVAALLVSCGRHEPAVPPAAQSFPSSEATNATTVFLTGPVVTTRITSGKIVSYAEQDSAWGYSLSVDFYDEQGKHTSILVADSALVREKARFLEVFGDVKITTDDGRTLETDRLAWNDNKRTISTDGYVVITKGSDVMRGYGFESDPELTHIRLRRQVTGRLTNMEKLRDTT